MFGNLFCSNISRKEANTVIVSLLKKVCYCRTTGGKLQAVRRAIRMEAKIIAARLDTVFVILQNLFCPCLVSLSILHRKLSENTYDISLSCIGIFENSRDTPSRSAILKLFSIIIINFPEYLHIEQFLSAYQPLFHC